MFRAETIVAAGAFLESAALFVDEEQMLEIEKAILIPGDNVRGQEDKQIERVQLRLLSRIPSERLTYEESILLVNTLGKADNKPLFSFQTTGGEYTTEMFLADQGVDVESLESQQLLAENQKMRLFIEQFLNEVPNPEMYRKPLEAAIRVFDAIKNSNLLQEELVQTLLTSIASICAIVLRSELVFQKKEPLNDDRYLEIKEMVLYCLSQHTKSDVHAEENYSPGFAYSPTPRSEAATALPRLFSARDDSALLPLIEQLASDNNAVARFGIIQSLHLLYAKQRQFFWHIVHERLNKEKDWFTKAAIISQLDKSKIFNEESDLFLEAFHLTKHDTFTIVGENTFLEAFLLIGLAFLKRTGDERINNIFEECLDQNLSIATDLIFQAFKLIEPANFYRDFSDAGDVQTSQRIVAILMELLNRCERILISVKPGDPLSAHVEQAFKIIDSMIQRIYFSMQVNKRIMAGRENTISPEAQEQFYFFIKPLLEKIVSISRQLDGGHIQGHSAHYFIEIMSVALTFDARYSLTTTKEVTAMAFGTQYTFDSSAIREAVKYTETLLADHKQMLAEPEAFGHVMDLLNMYVHSGWPEALDLLWRLDDIFR